MSITHSYLRHGRITWYCAGLLLAIVNQICPNTIQRFRPSGIVGSNPARGAFFTFFFLLLHSFGVDKGEAPLCENLARGAFF